MTDWTRYPSGTCVGCEKPTDVMPLCTDCRLVWEHDGDCWDLTDAQSQHVRDLAAAWTRGYQRGYGPSHEVGCSWHIGQRCICKTIRAERAQVA